MQKRSAKAQPSANYQASAMPRSAPAAAAARRPYQNTVAPGQLRGRPTDCNGRGDKGRATSRAKFHASPAPGENKPSRSVQNGSPLPVPPKNGGQARGRFGNRE